jgi:Flp pilus assembly protein TadB
VLSFGRDGAIMSDAEKPGDDLRANAALAVAKHAAERALEDALLTDDERAKRRAEQDALARRKRTTRIALVAIGALLVVGLVGLMFHYWYWSLLLGLVGVAGLYGRHRLRGRRARREKQRIEQAADAQPKARIAPAAESIEAPDSSIEDDLAELKARMKR